MQSLDSSCQEADFIINDALLKLKGSAANTSNVSRQATTNQYQSHNLHNFTQQQTSGTNSISQFQTLPSTSSLLHNITHIPNQPPAYIFDGADSPPDYTNITEDELLAAAVSAAEQSQQQQEIPPSLSSPTLLSNFNSIVSPSPVVPDALFSTPTTPTNLIESSQTIATPIGNFNTISTLPPPLTLPLQHNSQINCINKPDNKRHIIDGSTNYTLGNTINSSSSCLSAASSPKKIRLSNSQYSNSPPLLQPISSPLITTTLQHHNQQQKQLQNNTILPQQNQQTSNLCNKTSSANLNNSSGASTSNLPSTSGIGANSQQQSQLKFNSAYFDLFHKIRELYLYLLIHDEKALKESRRRYRTRSFVLERLVDREKLNTIVLNLHPGNKGYSLAFHNQQPQQNDDNNKYMDNSDLLLINNNNSNSSNNNNNNINNNNYSTNDVSNDNLLNNSIGIGSISSNNSKIGTNFSSSRSKQNQQQHINSSIIKNLTKIADSNLFIESNNLINKIDSNDLLLKDPKSPLSNNYTNINNNHILTPQKLIIDDICRSTKIIDTDEEDDYNEMDDDENDIIDINNDKSYYNNINNNNNNKSNNNNNNINNNSNYNNKFDITNDDYNDDSDEHGDENLIEIMRWPYETDELLNCIDNEEIPQIFSDLLIQLQPNVFYSGCVICQVRDFRQTFSISSNSCDIYHVLLKPTNDTLYTDVQQLQLDSLDLTSDDKLQLESQLVLATAEPLCLDPDPKIGEIAINEQFKRQMFNTRGIRRQMKKYSQIAINRKRKIDQFTYNYGLELCDYLQRIRQQRPPSRHLQPSSSIAGSVAVSTSTTTNNLNETNSSNTNVISSSSSAGSILSPFSSKLPRKPNECLKPIRTPNLDYPTLQIPTDVHGVGKYAKAYERPRDIKDCMPQLIEEYILETDREGGRIYHIKLSIYQRPANSEYLGELYVDRDYKEGERNGEACQFSLGTRSHANRYIQQFTEIFTEEGRKSVKISHVLPGQVPKVSYTTGISEHRKQQQLQAQLQQQQQQQLQQQQQQIAQQQQQQQHQQVLVATLTQKQQQHTQLQQPTIVAALPQHQAAPQQSSQHIQLPAGSQIVTTSLQGTNTQQQTAQIQHQPLNIVGIATTAGNVQHIRTALQQQQQPQSQQFIDAATGATVQLQSGTGTGTTHHQLSLSNGSLVLVQQQNPNNSNSTGIPQGITIQTAGGQQKMLSASQLAAVANSSVLRTQLSSSVPILQAQLKAGPLITTTNHQVIHQHGQKPVTHSANQTINALVTGLMNANQIQHGQSNSIANVQQQKTTSGSNAAILSLLNSAPAAMTSTPVASGTFTAGQQQQATILQPQQNQQQIQSSVITTDSILQQQQQQQQQQRKQNEVIQNLINTNLRKINMVTTNQQGTQSRIINSGGNLIALGIQSQQQDGHSNVQQQPQTVRVTMSALATQLASPPAIMTNANFTYATTPSANLTLNNNSIKIIQNPAGQQRVITHVRRDSQQQLVGVAASSPGSDSNHSTHSVASQSTNTTTTNLGNFAIPSNLSALLTTSPSPSSNDQPNIIGTGAGGSSGTSTGIVGITATGLTTNQTLLERLNSGASIISTSPGLSPQQPQQKSQQILQQQISSVQSPVATISPMSSPPPQPSPQQQIQITPAAVQHTSSGQQTTTLNLQGINLSSLQNAMTAFPSLQNVQVQIPGLAQPISLSLSGANLAAAVQQQQLVQQQQQATSLLVSVPVTNTTQVNQIQTVPGSGTGEIRVTVPASSVAQTQTVVLTNASGQSATHSLSLPLAQLVASGVKMNPQTIRTATIQTQQSQQNANIINAGNILQTTVSNLVSNAQNPTGNIQLLGTLQQRPRNIQVVSATTNNQKQLIANRIQQQQQQQQQQLGTGNQQTGISIQQQTQQSQSRNITPGQTLKITAPVSSQLVPANLTNNVVMTTQKLQLKLQKAPTITAAGGGAQQQQLQQQLVHQSTQQQQPQRVRRSTTDVNK